MKSCLKYFVLLFCLNFIEGSELFRCDYKYSSEAKGWFKHHVVPATWFDARLQCDLEGAVLASPTTPTMIAKMRSIINSSKNEQSYEIFTGIHATFSKGAYHTIEGLPLTKIPHAWALSEPDNMGNNESCLIFDSDGYLADISCEETRPFICYRSANSEMKVNECGTVDPEYRLDNRTKKCYKFHPVPRVFSRAFLACSAEGGHLAIINSVTEARVLSELFAKYPECVAHLMYVKPLQELAPHCGHRTPRSPRPPQAPVTALSLWTHTEKSLVGMTWKEIAFIGFHDWNEHGDWRTIHGQTLAEAGYGRFSSANPDNAYPGQYCGAMYRFGELDDMFCDKLAAFICEKSPDYHAPCVLSDLELGSNPQ